MIKSEKTASINLRWDFVIPCGIHSFFRLPEGYKFSYALFIPSPVKILHFIQET